jgi:hypothetical protein
MNTAHVTPQVTAMCDACRRPWFGSVAYCPYCGLKTYDHGVAPSRALVPVRGSRQAPDETPRAGEHETIFTLAPEPFRRAMWVWARRFRDVARKAPLTIRRRVPDRTLATALASTTAVLLAGLAVWHLAPSARENPSALRTGAATQATLAAAALPARASPPPPTQALAVQAASPVSVAVPAPAPAPAPSPAPAIASASSAAAPALTGPSGPPARALCSAASEAAGLCQSRP